ncbi:fructokinase [Myxococcaceae bacterium]|jgi:fructokinase|nr:fructokinase [Myxococcaceae bacterium]
MAFRVLGLGEVVMDLLPTGPRLGGAPANFAAHARALGADATIVSRVGEDDLGRDLLGRLEALGLPTRLVQIDREAPSGHVTVEIDPEGVPHFTIHEGVAFDRLGDDADAREAAACADAVCFGSLAQRSEPARGSIRRLVSLVPDRALRIFDVNLRAPFYTDECVLRSLELANVVKLGHEELEVVSKWLGLGGSDASRLSELSKRFGLRVAALTRGPRGSLLLGPEGASDHPGLAVIVRDTIGAGDSFTAALALGLLEGRPLDEVNALANQVARHVCSQVGAVPPLPAHLRAAFATAQDRTR